jgi:hypothetical protein
MQKKPSAALNMLVRHVKRKHALKLSLIFVYLTIPLGLENGHCLVTNHCFEYFLTRATHLDPKETIELVQQLKVGNIVNSDLIGIG